MRRDPAWVAVAAGTVLGGIGLLTGPGAFPHAWLSAVVLACAWPVGALLLLLSHALTGGRWGVAMRPGLLAGVAALAALPVLVLPLLFILPALYPWARSGGAALPNHLWLNLPFFAGRGVLYLVCWLGIGGLVLRGGWVRRWAPVALAVLALTWTFGSVDLLLSLDPRFTSSAFGMLSLAGAAVLALALGILLSPSAGPDADGDLGQLLLALALLWAYLDFMQLLIVWQSDLVTQVPWYRVRAFGAAGVVAGLVALTHTVIPFLALLSARVRRSRRWLRAVAVLMVGSEVLRLWWLVLPAAERRFGPLDAGCMLLVGGVLAIVSRRVRPAAAAHA